MYHKWSRINREILVWLRDSRLQCEARKQNSEVHSSLHSLSAPHSNARPMVSRNKYSEGANKIRDEVWSEWSHSTSKYHNATTKQINSIYIRWLQGTIKHFKWFPCDLHCGHQAWLDTVRATFSHSSCRELAGLWPVWGSCVDLAAKELQRKQ